MFDLFYVFMHIEVKRIEHAHVQMIRYYAMLPYDR